MCHEICHISDYLGKSYDKRWKETVIYTWLSLGKDIKISFMQPLDIIILKMYFNTCILLDCDGTSL